MCYKDGCDGVMEPWIAEDGSCRPGTRCTECKATWMLTVPVPFVCPECGGSGEIKDSNGLDFILRTYPHSTSCRYTDDYVTAFLYAGNYLPEDFNVASGFSIFRVSSVYMY